MQKVVKWSNRNGDTESEEKESLRKGCSSRHCDLNSTECADELRQRKENKLLVNLAPFFTSTHSYRKTNGKKY